MRNKPIGYFLVSVQFKVPVTDLAHYEATTFEEAASNQQGWFRDDPDTVAEAVSFASAESGFHVHVQAEQ